MFQLPDPISLVADVFAFIGFPLVVRELRKLRSERAELFGISSMVASDLKTWPGLTKRDAVKLELERSHFLATSVSDEVSALATIYDPLLQLALEDLDYRDFRVAARSLPSIVGGWLSESRNWALNFDRENRLDPSQLVDKLKAFNTLERIALLDCVVAERHRKKQRQ